MHRCVLIAPRVAVSILAVTLLGAFLVGALGLTTKRPNVTEVSGYELDNAPAAAARFPGNEIVVIADVEAELTARWNSEDRTPTSFIYTPVRVRIIEVLRGSPRLDDGGMVVRRLGGRVGMDEFVFSEGIAPPGLIPGNRLLLFLGVQRSVGDGMDAATPNMAYVIGDGDFVTSTDGRWTMDLATFRLLIEQSL